MTAVRLPSCVMSPRDWTTSQLVHAFVLGAVNSERQRWRREGPNGTDELWFVRTRQLWWTSSYVRPTYSILLSYLFIVYLEQLHNRPIASLSLHQTSNTPPSNSTSTSSSASSLSRSVHLDRALQYYKSAPPCPSLSPSSSSSRSSTLPGSRMTSCASSRASLSPPQDTFAARSLVCCAHRRLGGRCGAMVGGC